MLLTDLLQTKTLTLDLHQRDYRACKTIVCEIRLEDSLAQSEEIGKRLFASEYFWITIFSWQTSFPLTHIPLAIQSPAKRSLDAKM